MAIKVGMGFERTGPFALDPTLTLSKAQMASVDDNKMPDKYLTVCLDDGNIYIYDKQATPNAETGKFSLYSAGEAYDDTALAARVQANESALSNMYTKGQVLEQIENKLGAFDKLDYKIADAVPTASEVIIDGKAQTPEEGVRYLVKDATEDRYYEYILFNGTMHYMGAAASSAISAELTSELTVSNPIGRFTQGQTIPQSTSLEEIFRGLLTKTYNPTLTAPTAQLAFSVPALAKVGQNIAGGSATLSLNRGLIDPQYTSESQYRSGEATGFELTLSGADAPYTDNNDTGAFTVPAFTKSSKGMVTLTGKVDYAAGVQPKDSDGGDFGEPLEAGSVTASKNVEFILPFIHGVSASATVTENELAGMSEELTKKGAKTYSYNTTNEHMVFAYDASYGDLKSVLDPNSFETISGWVKHNVTIDGQLYSVYVAESATTDSGAAYTFKF